MPRQSRSTDSGTAPAAQHADAAPDDAGLDICLPATLGLAAAQALHGELRGAAAGVPVRLDASEVATMSTPGVLTLVAAVRSRRDDAPPIAVADPTPAFMDAFSDLGLFGDLMKMEFRT